MINVEKIEAIESLILCKVNKKPIGELNTSVVINQSRYIDEVATLKLSIDKYIVQPNGAKIINPFYEEAKPKRYVLLNNKEYFVIETVNENKLSHRKEITCYSGEKKLAKMMVELTEIYISLIKTDLESDIFYLGDLLKEIGWSLGEIDEDIIYSDKEKKVENLRFQESINMNWLDFIKNDLADQFSCMPIFDTINKKISLIGLDKLGTEVKIILSKDNYIKSKIKDISSEDLITLLKLQGSEELDVGGNIIGGYDFITNFSYFIDSKEMSDELISALKKYDEMIKIRTEQWKQLRSEKVAKQSELDINRNRWQISISTMERYKKEIEIYRLSEEENEEMKVLIAEITVALAEETDNELILRKRIENLNNEIYLLDESILNVNLLCKYESATDENGVLIFNKELLDEFSEFVFMDIYSDTSAIEADALIKQGNGILEERCKPTFTIEIDSMNFLNRIIDNGFRRHWNGTLAFCDIIALLDDDTNVEEYFYFIGYDLDYSSNRLNLKISNKKTNRDYAKTINQWLKETKNIKSILVANKHLFNDIKNNRINIDKKDVQ